MTRLNISIHATPTGRNMVETMETTFPPDFNSRDPYGPRSNETNVSGCYNTFQFTRPLRAAITIQGSYFYADQFQFTRPLRAAIVHIQAPGLTVPISIHATPTGRDTTAAIYKQIGKFQFTRPLRAAM